MASLGNADDQKDDDDALDPRVQGELDLLNEASGTINRIELELDEARCTFRQLLTESTHQLNALAKRLGSCIEKARPYYEARIKAKEAQVETQKATRRYERACSQLVAAKEMVSIAEVGFFKKGQKFDPAWQEMLNHATSKVNNAEKERLDGDLEHKRMAAIFNEREQKVKRLQKDLKRNIAKSRPYFELKAKFNQLMEEKKCSVDLLDKQLSESKKTYANSLQNLEAISEQIHQQRQEALLRRQMGSRGSGVGSDQPAPPPNQEVISKEPFGVYSVTPAMVVDDVAASPRRVRGKNWLSASSKDSTGSIPNSRDSSVVGSPRRSRPTSIDMLSPKKPQQISDLDIDSEETVVSSNISDAASLDMLSPVSDLSQTHLSGSINGSTAGSATTSSIASPEDVTISNGAISGNVRSVTVDAEHTKRTNAEVMRSVQHATSKKLNPYPAGHLLSVSSCGRGREGFMDELSDTESLTGSLASVSMLDDDQVQSLMVEAEDLAAQVLCGEDSGFESTSNKKLSLATLPLATSDKSRDAQKITPEQALIAETSSRLQELVEKCLLDGDQPSYKTTFKPEDSNSNMNEKSNIVLKCSPEDKTIEGSKSEEYNLSTVNRHLEDSNKNQINRDTINKTVKSTSKSFCSQDKTAEICHPLQQSDLPDICPKGSEM